MSERGLKERYERLNGDIWHEVFATFDAEPDMTADLAGRLAQAAFDGIEKELTRFYDSE